MKFHCKILDKNALSHETDEDFKNWLKLKDGDYCEIETWKERNVTNHRRFFALLNRTIYLLPDEPEYDKLRNIDYLRKELMILIGQVDTHITMKGELILIPKSISFKSMDDVEFNRIYHLCTEKIVRTFLKDISLEDFEVYILKFI